ncbi:Condensin complex subunit 1 [Yarrowia sp. B02]|nr:Condensin complex subunit 1 [Yarrowia sp. B02]
MTEFILNEVYTEYLEDAAQLVSRANSPSDFNYAVNELIEDVAVNSSQMFQPHNLTTTYQILLNINELTSRSLGKLADLLQTCFRGSCEAALEALERSDSDIYTQVRSEVELFGFLVQWLISALAHKVSTDDNSGGKGRKKDAEVETLKRYIVGLMEASANIMDVQQLRAIFGTSQDHDTFSAMICRAAYRAIETEALGKDGNVRDATFDVIIAGIKFQNQANMAHSMLLQHLNYYEHLSEPVAELLAQLYKRENESTVSEAIILEVSQMHFSNTDSKAPKAIAMFLVKLSQLAPKLVLKQMAVLRRLLESDSYAIRNGIVDSCSQIVVGISTSGEDSEHYRSQIEDVLELVEERILDVSPYVRSRVLQLFSNVCDLEVRFNAHFQQTANMAVECLNDKSGLVRGRAAKLLQKLVTTHPFAALHGAQLNMGVWKDRLAGIEVEIEDLEKSMPAEMNGAYLDPPSDDEGEKSADADVSENLEKLKKLQLTQTYYKDALKFMAVMKRAFDQAEVLLFSKVKTEVMEMMDMFVLADAYNFEGASSGIRKMLHVIWTKGNSDEGKEVQERLLSAYSKLFFEAPMSIPDAEASMFIARNLISLTYGATLAELASLERLLCVAMEKGIINALVVRKLWQTFGYTQGAISRSQRRGAVIVLGMLAQADAEIINVGLETLLTVGLGAFGQKDLVLAKYACVALQRLGGDPKLKGSMSSDSAVILALMSIVEFYTEDLEWFDVAAQSLNAIFILASSPEEITSEIIRRKTISTFSEGSSGLRDIKLSQLLVVVGHAAIKLIVYLEQKELEFKRLKVMVEKAKSGEAGDDDMEQIGGTSEDDFSEIITSVREREILYGDNSLLAQFGPLVVEVCSNNLKYSSETLQIAASSCLSKLMCVSPLFCQQSLPLLITIMEKSENPIIRSNAVIALGDMTICFNHLLDENTNYLYERLHDSSPMVQRTTLMTLTFLILAGQVKVKGQLGEMAKCLENPDKRISDLSRMFFTELATKDNAIYNGYIDIFSVLSADEELSDDQLKRVVRFLTSFVEKERHVKQLSDKLFARLGRCETEKQWKDVSFALGLLPHKNESIQDVIAEGFKVVQKA